MKVLELALEYHSPNIVSGPHASLKNYVFMGVSKNGVLRDCACMMLRPRATRVLMRTPYQWHLRVTLRYEVLKHNAHGGNWCPLTPILVWGRQGDCNESPTPQRDPKVMGKVRLTTEVPIRRNLVYPHTSASARNRTRNRNYISPTSCRPDYAVLRWKHR